MMNLLWLLIGLKLSAHAFILGLGQPDHWAAHGKGRQAVWRFPSWGTSRNLVAKLFCGCITCVDTHTQYTYIYTYVWLSCINLKQMHTCIYIYISIYLSKHIYILQTDTFWIGLRTQHLCLWLKPCFENVGNAKEIKIWYVPSCLT